LEHSGVVESIAFSPDGKWLVAAGFGNQLATAWEVKTWEKHLFGRNDVEIIAALTFSGDGKRLALAHRNSVRMWDLGDECDVAAASRGEQVQVRSPGYTGRPCGAGFSPDGRYLAINYATGMIILWDLEGKKALFHRDVPDNAAGRTVFNPNTANDGRYGI